MYQGAELVDIGGGVVLQKRQSPDFRSPKAGLSAR